jgi:hypothetical protein
MQKIAGNNFESADMNRGIRLRDMSVGVGDGDGAGEKLKTEAFNLIQVANGAIRDNADAPHRLKNGRVSFTNESRDPRVLIGVLDYNDARRGNRLQVVPPISPLNVKSTFHRRIRAVQPQGHSEADGRFETRKSTANGRIAKTDISKPQSKALDCIRYGART